MTQMTSYECLIGITLMKTLPQKEGASGCVDACTIQTEGSDLYELNITTCFEISKPYCTTSTTIAAMIMEQYVLICSSHSSA